MRLCYIKSHSFEISNYTLYSQKSLDSNVNKLHMMSMTDPCTQINGDGGWSSPNV